MFKSRRESLDRIYYRYLDYLKFPSHFVVQTPDPKIHPYIILLNTRAVKTSKESRIKYDALRANRKKTGYRLSGDCGIEVVTSW